MVLLQAASVLYAVGSVVIRGFGIFEVWNLVSTVVVVLLLQVQRSLLTEVFSGRAVEEHDSRLGRHRTLYLAVIGLGALQLGLVLLVLLTVGGSAELPDNAVIAGLLFLIAAGASLYAAYGTLVSLSALMLAPGDGARRATARDWLWRNAFATGIVAVMNLADGLRNDTAGSLLAASVLVSVLDVAWPALTRRALQES